MSASDSRSRVGSPPLAFSSRFHLPLSPQRKPIVPRGATTLPDCLVEGDGLPFRIVGLAERLVEVAGAQEAVRHQVVALPHEPHQHRHVGVLAHVVAEIGHLAVDVIFLEDHVAHRHGERRIGALLHD